MVVLYYVVWTFLLYYLAGPAGVSTTTG